MHMYLVVLLLYNIATKTLWWVESTVGAAVSVTIRWGNLIYAFGDLFESYIQM